MLKTKIYFRGRSLGCGQFLFVKVSYIFGYVVLMSAEESVPVFVD
jgi:hypothetical protein